MFIFIYTVLHVERAYLLFHRISSVISRLFVGRTSVVTSSDFADLSNYRSSGINQFSLCMKCPFFVPFMLVGMAPDNESP
jgi:hypothetical protein